MQTPPRGVRPRLRVLADWLRLHVVRSVVRTGTVTQLDLVLLGLAAWLGRLGGEDR